MPEHPIPSDRGPSREVYTVSRLNREARALVEEAFDEIWVEGELSNVARPASGHLYFSLKDERAQVRCAMFRGDNRHLDFSPAEGQHVVVRGRASIYPARGDFQLIASYMEEAGAGALGRAFEALKRKLHAEGLFDENAKRPLPAFPMTLGVITSPTGAALRDVLAVVRRRHPGARVIVYPTLVQGEEAAPAIVRALETAAARAECDVLLLVRGGGSVEDLWAFNEEAVARAVHACALPIVAGVGHEVDVTIVDFVADRRAATPSAAAELVTPDTARWLATVKSLRARLDRQVRRVVSDARQRAEHATRRVVHPRRRLAEQAARLEGLEFRLRTAGHGAVAEPHSRLRAASARLARLDPLAEIAARRAVLSGLERRCAHALQRRVAEFRGRLAALERALGALSPQSTLERGYAIVNRRKDGAVLRDADAVRRGETVDARLARGTLELEVK